jgi:hypothetical protein
LCDGATSLTTAEQIRHGDDISSSRVLRNLSAEFQLNPKYIVADQAFMGTEMEKLLQQA